MHLRPLMKENISLIETGAHPATLLCLGASYKSPYLFNIVEIERLHDLC